MQENSAASSAEGLEPAAVEVKTTAEGGGAGRSNGIVNPCDALPSKDALRDALVSRDEALMHKWMEEASSSFIMARWLLATEVDDSGNTFLHTACSQNLTDTLIRLFTLTLSVNLLVRNAGEETPLHMCGSQSVIVLLEEGRRRYCVKDMVTAQDARGWTALDHAVDKGDWKVADEIRAAGGVCMAKSDPCPAHLELPPITGNKKYRHPQCIQYCSDLHLEFFDGWGSFDVSSFIHPVAPYLALLGDIAVPKPTTTTEMDVYRRFLLAVADMFEKVLVLSGNHEYYDNNRTVEETDAIISTICASHPNLVYCRRASISAFEGRVRILATSTLWSFVPPYAVSSVENGMMDFKRIRVGAQRIPLTHTQVNEWHHETVAWLSQELRRSSARGERVVVMSHHAPTFQMTSPTCYRGPLLNQLSYGFATNLEILFRKFNHAHTKVENSVLDTWAFGHTHHNTDVVLHGTRLVANQYGYHRQEMCQGFKPDRVIDLRLDSWFKKGARGELLRRFSRTPSY